ncbi:integrator complex subunit 10-like [Saccostrea echinata]|uniref:integrator complex subunit 10-like n=1 Tax=Saccostrea echinata TaxID=191078 RepID=UPI002A834066|nr:integrator complex subunit 10-like [Saccostrea echinata]
MAATMSEKSMSDEVWLISRARACMKPSKNDPYAAKAWMITARSLFPNNFSIQFEAYSLEKAGRNVKEAAKLLEEMFVSFPNESQLWEEIQEILEILQTEMSANSHKNFLTEIFAAVSTPSQCQMLLSVAQKISNTLEQCRLLLLAMRKFPNLVFEHGLKLLDTLQQAELEAKIKYPVNCYRKLFVCDVLPLVLQKVKKLEIQKAQIYRWLQMSVEFYIMYVTQSPSFNGNTRNSPEMLSPTKLSNRVSIPGLFDKECQVSDPWGSLLKLIILLGQLMDWDVPPDLFSEPREIQYKNIYSLYNRARQSHSPEQTRQVLYTTVVLFLECLYTYVSSVDPQSFLGPSASHTPLVLMEKFENETSEEEPQAKKVKVQADGNPTIVGAECLTNSSKIINSFTTAFKCYELMHSTTELQTEFMKLCEIWHMETWTWMGHFQTDMLIYQGAFTDAIAHLQNFSSAIKENMQLRSNLQMACCFYCLQKYSKACELVLNVIKDLPYTHDRLPISNLSEPTGAKGRQLWLTKCTEAEILPYCIQLLLAALKSKAFSSKGDDTSLGHMVVLLQYDWPKSEALFYEVLKKVILQNSLVYNQFFNYVINVDILEEFAFLKTSEGGKVNLDILPTSVKVISQQRTVTRGVNKGVKEDFKQTMVKQVGRSEEPVEKLIRTFLTNERISILKALT